MSTIEPRSVFAKLRADARRRMDEMARVCEAVECRWRQVKEVFAEEGESKCARCDVCEPSMVRQP